MGVGLSEQSILFETDMHMHRNGQKLEMYLIPTPKVGLPGHIVKCYGVWRILYTTNAHNTQTVNKKNHKVAVGRKHGDKHPPPFPSGVGCMFF